MGPGRDELDSHPELVEGHAEVLGRYVGAFVDELVAAGVEHVCLCPGSRSTPLALTFARHPHIKIWTHLDERSCAYFALGMSKKRSFSPVAILCSSGTAAVNFGPAVVEAFHAHVPLIVLTADRPPELREVGANQTIDQVGLYGSAVRWAVNMPLPDASDVALRYVRMVAARAVDTAREGGPVHLNFPFREPLVPAAQELASDHTSGRFTRQSTFHGDLAGLELKELLGRSRHGAIVCGPNTWVHDRSLVSLANQLGFPILADPLSRLRCGRHIDPIVVSAYDSFLRIPSLVDALAPDLILRFGMPPTSKPLASYLTRFRNVRQIAVTSFDAWPDPDLTADEVIYAEEDLSDLLDLTELFTQINHSVDSAWLTAWREAEEHSWAAIRTLLAAEEAINEPSAIYDLADAVPEGFIVFAGNSMPVRDLDTFWPAGPKLNFFEANRGASGIDGVVSTALGMAAVSYGFLVAVIGDLSFYHDMNGLLAAKRFGLKATIVLVNNDGGGIFSFLPQNDDQEYFEALFGTPHGLDFAPVAELYGLGWQSVTTRAEYRAALEASFDAPGVNVIEVKTNRAENVLLHQRIWQAVADGIHDLVPSPSGRGLG